MITEKPWWYPQLADAEWIARLRTYYPEDTAGKSDEEVRDKYSDGWKYADTWDHLSDARAEYEQLADAYLALLATPPPQPSVSEGSVPEMAVSMCSSSQYAKGWNDCRSAMLAAPQPTTKKG